MIMLRVLDLFSGIRGFSIGLERAGMRTVAFCDNNQFCQRVLRKRWPGVPVYDDVRELTADALRRDGITVDVICGGFPCQDISLAGERSGLAGARSGLWSEIARLTGELRPAYLFVENVPGLLSSSSRGEPTGRDFGRVLGDLAALGYDAVWDCIPASAVGAPHRRDRVWVVAHARGEQHQGDSATERGTRTSELSAPDTQRGKLRQQPGRGGRAGGEDQTIAGDDGAQGSVADAAGLAQREPAAEADALAARGDARPKPRRRRQPRDPGGAGLPPPEQEGVHGEGRGDAWRAATQSDWWAVEPDVGRVVARLSSWVDGGRLENADACEGGTYEILRALFEPDGSAALQWTSRGSVGLHAAEVLLAHVCEYEGPPRTLGNVSLAGAAASPLVLRGLWFDGTLACPSCRRAAGEQRAVEHPDAMHVVSRLLACDCRAAWLDRSGSSGTAKRVDRLTALGNAVVPQVVEIIGRAIVQASMMPASRP